MKYFVSAIGTDSGKTVVSAILCQAFGFAYWKPIQCGFPTDLSTVKQLVSNKNVEFYDEKYLLKMPASPHAAAKDENIVLKTTDFICPDADDIVIEGAGGLLVPMNDDENIVDLIHCFGAELLLVANLYLGSINHTLLSVELLKQRNITVKGIVFNGPTNTESERIILERSGYRQLLHLPQLDKIDSLIIQKYADELRSNW